MTTMSMKKETNQEPLDLFSFSYGNMPRIERSETAVPPVVRSVLTDADGMYAEPVFQAGISNHPQIVAVTVAECNKPYVSRLLDLDPEVGCALVYGTLKMRGSIFVSDVLDVASESLLHSTDLSPRQSTLLAHCVETALKSRDLCEINVDMVKADLKRFEEVRDICIEARKIEAVGNVSQEFPTFSRLSSVIDELKQRTLTNGTPHDDFFASLETTTENYFKAVFGILSGADTPTQHRALAYFDKLDKPLLERLRFGLEHGYLKK